VNDDARALFQHGGQQPSIQANRCEQIHIQCPLPFAIVQHGDAAHRSGRSTDDVYDDIDAAESTVHRLDDRPAAIGCRDIGCDKIDAR
jgi:hypothetical protein